MHDGFHVYDVDSGESLANKTSSSIAYGCDWIERSKSDADMIASCSFYNHEAQLWSISE